MKTLSVKQPWAWLICSGVKDIENRTWLVPKRYIGQRVLIHASKKPDMKDLHFQPVQWKAIDAKSIKLDDLKCHNSDIIGSVEIADCMINHPSIWAEKGVYNWVLKNPILFPEPITGAKGKLGFWEYELHEECGCGSLDGFDCVCDIDDEE